MSCAAASEIKVVGIAGNANTPPIASGGDVKSDAADIAVGIGNHFRTSAGAVGVERGEITAGGEEIGGSRRVIRPVPVYFPRKANVAGPGAVGGMGKVWRN